MKIFLQGADGRMGKEMAELVRSSKKFQLVDLKGKPNLVIDFSAPEGTMSVLAHCLKSKAPLLTGTTGFSAEQIKKITAASKKIAILKSANLSLGINSLIQAMRVFQKSFKPNEIIIEETHHIHKKDKPSGTALLLKAELQKAARAQIAEPLSLREGEVFGIHKVIFKGANEWVSFEHHAENRKIFAQGALDVAPWLVKQKPGLYSMEDFLSKGRKK